MDLEPIKQWVGILSQAGFFGMFAWLCKSGINYMKQKHALQKEDLMAKDQARKQAADDKQRKHDETVTAMKNTDALLKAGVVAMLHHEIYQNCSSYLDRKCISTGELNDLEYLFTSYKALGGNGTGEILYTKCKSLPIRKDENIEKN